MPQDEVNRRSQNTIRLSSCVFVKPSSRGAACANQSVSRSLSSATNLCLEILQSISLTGGFLDYGGFLEFSLFWSKTFVSFLFFTFSFEYCTIAQMSNSNCSKKLATFESGGSALIKHFSLKRATYYLDQFSSFVGEICSFVFIDDYAYILNFRNPDNFPAILNIYRLNVKSKNQSCKCTFCEITSHCTKLSRSHLSG